MFKIAVDNLVNNIGDDVYLPSPSTAASKNLAPLSLVERKDSIILLKRSKSYHTTNFTLADVMVEGGEEVKLKSDQPLCSFSREYTVKVHAALKGQLKYIFDAGVCGADKITIKTDFGQLYAEEVDMHSLLDHINSRELNTNHPLVKELSKTRRRALCLVTGVVKTTSDSIVSAMFSSSFEGKMEIDVPDEANNPTKQDIIDELDGILSAEINGAGVKNSIKKLWLPAGTTLAYELMEMSVDKKGRVKLMVSHKARGGFHTPATLQLARKDPIVPSKKRSKKT